MFFSRQNKIGIARELIGWVTLSMLATGLALIVLLNISVGVPMERELRDEADRVSQAYALSLREAVWNLDVDAIRQGLNHQPMAIDIAAVRVFTEYGDLIVEEMFLDVSIRESVCRRQAVLQGPEIIGFVEVAMSRRRVAGLRAIIGSATSLVVLVAVACTILVALVLVRVLIAQPLQALGNGLDLIAEGNYHHRLSDVRHSEMDMINHQVNRMAEQIAERTGQLESLRDNLETLVENRTRALAESNRRLEEEGGRRKAVQNRLLVISTLEQQRIGRDLHDTLGQQLAGVGFIAGSLIKTLGDKGLPEAETACQVSKLISESLGQVRRIARGLTPSELNGRTITFALQQLIRDAQVLFGVDCELHHSNEDLELHSDEAAGHLYRIAQEAIHNAVRHGKAKHIWMSLCDEDEGLIRLTIQDDGQGMTDAVAGQEGLGLTTMRYRADMIDGTLEIGNTEELGVRVTLVFHNDGPGPE